MRMCFGLDLCIVLSFSRDNRIGLRVGIDVDLSLCIDLIVVFFVS